MEISTGSDEWVYDDTLHSLQTHDYTPTSETEGLVNGHSLQVSGWKAIEDVACVENDVDYEIIRADGSSVNLNNYEIEESFGSLKITPRSATLETDSQTWTYDGIAHSFASYDDTGLLAGHRIIDAEWMSIQTLGEAENTVSFKISDENGREIPIENYDFSFTWGTLTVVKREIKIVSYSETWEYNGETKKNASFDVTEGSLAPEQRIIVDSAAGIENVGSIDNELVYRIVDQNGETVSSNYDITFESGILIIIQRPLILVTQSDEKVYDDVALRNEEVLASCFRCYDSASRRSLVANFHDCLFQTHRL